MHGCGRLQCGGGHCCNLQWGSYIKVSVCLWGLFIGKHVKLTFSLHSEGINLVKVRGEAMQAASEMADSGMMTVFVGADQKLNFGCEVAREWCRRHHDIEEPVCQVFT